MKVSKILLLAMSVGLLLMPSQLSAQATDEQAAADQAAAQAAAADVGQFSGEITVTAQKREEALIEIPISIRAVTSDELETINAQELADIARMVPSMSMTDLSRGGNNVQIRGLGSNVGNVGTVAMFNDGIVSATRTQSDGTFAEQDPTLFDLERVEVLRGPQGTLYGEGSFGGVINFISRRPDPSKFSASFSGDYFSIKDGDSSNYNAAAMVNIPIAQDRWALRLVAHTRDRGGYVDSVDVLPVLFGLPAVPAGEDTNTEKFYGGRMLLGYTGEKVFANLIVKTQKTKLGESNFSSPGLIGMVNDLTGSTFDTELSLAVFGGPLSDTESTTNEAVLDINVVTPIGLFTSITGYGEVESEFFIDPGTLSENEAFSQEFRLSSESSAAVNYTVGAYYRDAERLFELGHGGGIPFGFTSMEQWSIYGQLYWDISSELRATGTICSACRRQRAPMTMSRPKSR
jgi:outer membrane receptor protein involved in Fe transport